MYKNVRRMYKNVQEDQAIAVVSDAPELTTKITHMRTEKDTDMTPMKRFIRKNVKIR